MDQLSAYQQEIESLRQSLEEKEKLLDFTRSYADRLLSQVNQQVESIQEQQRVVEHQHRQLLESIECAKQVLATVTTSNRDLEHIYPESFIVFRPRDLIGGDFFWMHTKGSKVFVAAGDCTGHGVSGGILSLMANMLLKQAVIERNIEEPSEVLTYIDQVVCSMTDKGVADLPFSANIASDIAMDMLISVHDLQEEVLYVSSAHMPWFVWQDQHIQRVKGGGAGIGVAKKQKKPFNTVSWSLQEDTVVYYTSDGFADQFQQQTAGSKKVRKFGRTRMLDMFENIAQMHVKSQKQEILDELNAWQQGAQQTDDIMLMGIKYGSHSTLD